MIRVRRHPWSVCALLASSLAGGLPACGPPEGVVKLDSSVSKNLTESAPVTSKKAARKMPKNAKGEDIEAGSMKGRGKAALAD